jgi:hypothetical protein
MPFIFFNFLSGFPISNSTFAHSSSFTHVLTFCDLWFTFLCFFPMWFCSTLFLAYIYFYFLGILSHQSGACIKLYPSCVCWYYCKVNLHEFSFLQLEQLQHKLQVLHFWNAHQDMSVLSMPVRGQHIHIEERKNSISHGSYRNPLWLYELNWTGSNGSWFPCMSTENTLYLGAGWD